MTRKYPILLLLGLILFTGFVSSSLISYRSAHDSLAREIEESTLPLTGDNIYSEIQQDLLRPIFISSLMAHDTFLRDWVLAGEQDEASITRYLKEIQARYDTESSFFVSERTRRYYHPSGQLKTVRRDDAQDAWYFRFKSHIEPYEINIDHDTAQPDQLSVFINYKVYDYQGNFIGATGVGLSTAMVRQLIDSYQRRYNREVFFVDRLGRLTLHNSRQGVAGTLHDDPELGLYATRILTSPSSHFSYTAGHDTVYVNSRLIPEFDWYLIVRERLDPSEDKIFQTLIMNLVGATLITLIVLALTWATIGRFQRRLEEMALTDKLTGLANRQMLDRVLPRQLAQAQRRQEPLSCIIADLDGFKQINDRFGHPTGDRLLHAVAALLSARVRAADLVCRWGGDEFLFLLPACDHDQAARFAEQLRQSVAAHRLEYGPQQIGVSLSLGIAELQPGESAEQLIARTDQALLAAKQRGRNQVSGCGDGSLNR